MYCNDCHYDIPTLNSKKCPICGSKNVTQNQNSKKKSSKGLKTGIGIGVIFAIIVVVFFIGDFNVPSDTSTQIIESSDTEKIILPENSQIQEEKTVQEENFLQKEKPPLKENIQTGYSKQELYQYALERVNEDRKKHGVLPVNLGTSTSAQNHADDQLQNSYFSHWNSKGVKPYVTYTQLGGTASVGENNAFTSTTCPTSNCISNVWNPYEQIKSHQYGMMYDDAHSNWGHRDNIIDPHHTLVNFGISWNENEFYFVQQFETEIIQWNNLEIVNDRILNLNGKIPSNYKLSSISIFEDSSSKQVSGTSLNNEFPYNAGYYDQGRFVGMLVEPPQTGYFYEECSNGKLSTSGTGGTQCVNYIIYDEIGTQINQLNIRADVSQWLSENNLHTIYVTLEDTTTEESVQVTSLTLEYLEGGIFYP